ncbi:hypothetical protein L209DRAFT_269706 [Thermothelomyces heterothallicus CBS 203.75]
MRCCLAFRAVNHRQVARLQAHTHGANALFGLHDYPWQESFLNRSESDRTKLRRRTMLGCPHSFRGELFRFLNGIIWSIILNLFAWSNFLFLLRPWSISTRFSSLSPFFDDWFTHSPITSTYDLFALRHRQTLIAAEYSIHPHAAYTETSRLQFLSS